MGSKRLMTAALLLTQTVTAAIAQRPKEADLTGEVVACRTISLDGARLACFDRAAARLATAQQAGDIVVVDRKAVVERRRRAFGLPLANTLATADVKGIEVKELTSTIRSVAPSLTPDQYRIVLSDGTAWQMLDPGAQPRPGAKITIGAVRLGGFRAKVDGQRPFLVKRLR